MTKLPRIHRRPPRGWPTLPLPSSLRGWPIAHLLSRVPGLQRLSAWLHRRSFAFQFTAVFALVTLALMTGGGVVFSRYVVDAVTGYEAEELAREAQVVGNHAARQLSPGDIAEPMTGKRYQEFASFLQDSILSSLTVRVKVWNREGTVIFSDNPEETGSAFPIKDDLRHALDGGTTSDLSGLEAIENAGERRFGRLLEVYTPLRLSGSDEVVGAFEVYQDYSGVEALASRVRAVVIIGLGAVLGPVFAATCWLVMRGSRIMERRDAELQRAKQETERANEELRERNRQLLDARAQAATDALTGLPNHRAFHEKVRDETQRAEVRKHSLGLIMLDIDQFKRVNDRLGHQAGDQLLREVALTLASVVRREHAYRYGGDEFAVLLPAVDRRKTASVAERLRRAVERGVDGNGEKITVSLGVASFPDSAASVEELIYGADAAMYWAKSAGKNRVGDWGELVNHMRGGPLPWYAADRGVRAPDVVTALIAALAAKDPTTRAHTERCSWYAVRLAEELGLSDEDTSVVRLASLLHDIGKLAVPDDVLFKCGPLNEDEWAEMKKHPTVALHVLGQIRSMSDATPAILHHHEHFDGSGYPDGLAGDHIPMASRVLLVTDAFDAMTTDRPYRKATPVEAAIEELKRCSGSQFDPAVVDAFLRILSREGAEPLRRNAAARAESVVGGPAGQGGGHR